MKKIISLTLSFIMLFSIIAGLDFSSYAAVTSGTCGDNLTWVLDDEDTLTISGTGDMANYSYSSNHPWYESYESIKRVIIDSGVTSIGNYAFFHCDGLTSVTIPDSLTSIGQSTFEDCTGLTSVTIPDSVTNIGDHAFGDCTGLTSITIPSSVTLIYSGAFANCSGLTIIIVDSNNEYYDSRNNCNAIIKTDSNSLVTGCKNTTIPNCVTTIEDNAFYGCTGLTSIIKPTSVTNIDDKAFYGCKDLANIYYTGSENDWNWIFIGSDNYALTESNIHYNFCSLNPTPEAGHKEVIDKSIASTCTKTGVKTYTCTVCDQTRTETVAKNTHTYTNVVTKATTNADGKIIPTCSVCKATKAATVIKKASSIKLSATAYTYDGKVKTPSVTVKNSAGSILKKNTDYTVSYASGRKNVGTYKVTIKGKGKYSFTKTLTFKINPAKTSVSSLTAYSKAFSVKWSKKSAQVTGYQIQYSTSSKFSSPKTVTVTSYKTTSKRITKLIGNKKYYVRVRTYKTVGSTKYYSAWSSAKYVTTKK